MQGRVAKRNASTADEHRCREHLGKMVRQTELLGRDARPSNGARYTRAIENRNRRNANKIGMAEIMGFSRFVRDSHRNFIAMLRGLDARKILHRKMRLLRRNIRFGDIPFPAAMTETRPC